MSQLNLAIHDVAADVAFGDVFGETASRSCVPIALSPFHRGTRGCPFAERLTDDPRWVWGEPGPNDGNAAWTQHCLSHLADERSSGDRAAERRPVRGWPRRPHSTAHRQGRAARRGVRVAAGPVRVDAACHAPCSSSSRGERTLTASPRQRSWSTSPSRATLSRGRTTTLADELIDEVAELYREWVDGRQSHVSTYAAVASFDDLAANEFVIDPGRYLSLPHTAPDIAKADRRRAELVDQLAALTKASRDADAHLHAILEARR